ncbi:hypothetical protein [uncultured Pseudokineococcus sp.]|uniref:hypothetical protein n=1 Tax=uncultured Pseudokineococcus sp. TaxID=1642928 RepID=UPI00262D84C8|nr:hypothetical protein [uncultured Pseudokineococcus sp.]
MTTTSPAPAAPPSERSTHDTALPREELAQLQDTAAARSWAGVDRRRDPRRRHR